MKQVVLALLLSLTSVSGYAGGGAEGSGGSDYFRPVRAWFLSQDKDKVIKACYEVSPNFGVSEQELTTMVRNAFSSWGEYIKSKRLSSSLTPNSLRIISAIDMSPVCDGKEDLKFYFGTNDLKVVEAKVQYVNPFGFAELDRHKSSDDPNWLPGFIWISDSAFVFPEKKIPDWKGSKESLNALLLHEVGHIFGCGHVDDTVMTSHLAEFLKVDTDPVTPLKWISSYNRIDSALELVPCLECSVSYHAPRQFDGSPFNPGSDDLSNAFRLLTGKDPVEPLSATFVGVNFRQSEVVFTDGSGIQRFPINIMTQVGGKKDSARLFSGLGGKYFVSFGVSYFGEIKPASGTPIPVAINYNMDRRKLSIVPLGYELNPKPLFVAVP